MDKAKIEHCLKLLSEGQDFTLVIYNEEGEEISLGDTSLPDHRAAIIQYLYEQLRKAQ